MRRLNALRRDERGSPLIEFVLIFPILIFAYIATIETSNAIAIYRKNILLSSTLADLVSRADDLNRADIESMLLAGDVILPPNRRYDVGMRIAMVKLDDAGDPTELWTVSGGRAIPANDHADLTERYFGREQNLIVVETLTNYTPILVDFVLSNLNLYKQSVVFPRQNGVEEID